MSDARRECSPAWAGWLFVGAAWTRAVLVVSARPFARALIAPTMAWLVPAAILFGGQGITAKTAVSALRSSPLAWAVLLFAFASLTTPAVAAAVHAKGTLTLRSLQRPASSRARVVPLAGMLLFAQLPIVVLFARAGEPVAAAVQAVFMLGLELAFAFAARAVVRCCRVERHERTGRYSH